MDYVRQRMEQFVSIAWQSMLEDTRVYKKQRPTIVRMTTREVIEPGDANFHPA